MASDIFEAGKATSTTRQPATPARREAVLAFLSALDNRQLGGWYKKPAIDLDLSALLNVIRTDPDALTKITQQSGRPASPSTFQNLMQGGTTLALLAKLLTEGSGDGGSVASKIWDRIFGGQGSDVPVNNFVESNGMAADDGLALYDFLSQQGTGGAGTYGVNMSDAGGGIDDLAWLWS